MPEQSTPVDHLKMPDLVLFRTELAVSRPSVADQVFDLLHAQVQTTALPPGTKLSEAEVARQLNVSRQPVRDAFFRLAQLGFLVIRPQRSTTVSLISSHAILKARFLRSAIEVEVIRRACTALTPDDLAGLEAILTAQQAAIDAGDTSRFHRLDYTFHRTICDGLGLDFAWDVIRDYKAHTDRIRLLSLSFAAQTAWSDHRDILDALHSRNTVRAEAAMRLHLDRIIAILDRVRSENHDWFANDEQSVSFARSSFIR